MDPDSSDILPSTLLDAIRNRADVVDQSAQWPAEDLALLASHGLLKAAVGREWGGDSASALDQHLVYESLTRASLSVSLILSQRDSAVGLIEASESPLRDRILPSLAAGSSFATVGIAQLTTSRQGGAPALRATTGEGGYRFDGLIPWCTGASHAEHIVAGAATDEGLHVLALLPTNSPGLRIDPPMPLVALASTHTTSLHCDGVFVHEDHVLRTGPHVLSRANHLPLGQAFLATGLTRGAIDLISRFRSPASEKARARLDEQLAQVRGEVLRLSHPETAAEATELAPVIRGRCNDLALRATHAAVTLYKGTGLLTTHPAQRLAREALFLLVWSCPTPVIDCTLDLLTDSPPT
jgi:butyryl-CoA dehydrogenase